MTTPTFKRLPPAAAKALAEVLSNIFGTETGQTALNDLITAKDMCDCDICTTYRLSGQTPGMNAATAAAYGDSDQAASAAEPEAYKLTVEDLEAKIVNQDFTIIPGTTTTVCSLELENGYVVIGKSACVNPDNFDEGIGRDIARQDAFRQIWSLEGYLLKERMYQNELVEHRATGEALGEHISKFFADRNQGSDLLIGVTMEKIG